MPSLAQVLVNLFLDSISIVGGQQGANTEAWHFRIQRQGGNEEVGFSFLRF